MKNNHCAFCDAKVINKQKYYESKYFFVLVDSMPITYAHSLIVPKRHVYLLSSFNNREVINLFETIRYLNQKLLPYFDCDSYNLLSNNGANAGQTVLHAHFHFIPRKKGDRNGDFKNLCFPTEKNRQSLTNQQFKTKTRKLSKLMANNP